MLNKAKPIFEEEVREALETGMYEAFYGMFKRGDNPMSDHIDKYTKKISKEFAERVASKIYEPLTDAIDKYIKSMDIYAMVGPTGIALAGTSGAVTGTINITPQTSKIEIK